MLKMPKNGMSRLEYLRIKAQKKTTKKKKKKKNHYYYYYFRVEPLMEMVVSTLILLIVRWIHSMLSYRLTEKT